MSEPLRGRALALEALRRIEADPKEWNQKEWRCGTACCFAGHIALAAGYEWDVPEDPLEDWMRPPDNRDDVLHAKMAAERALGVQIPANTLFAEWNTLDDLKRLIDEYLPPEAS